MQGIMCVCVKASVVYDMRIGTAILAWKLQMKC